MVAYCDAGRSQSPPLPWSAPAAGTDHRARPQRARAAGFGRSRQGPGTLPGLAVCVAFACLCVSPALALDRGVLVEALRLPPITMNLNVTFATSELKIPLAKDPAAEVTATRAQLAEDDRPSLHLRLGKLLTSLGRTEEAGAEYRIALQGFSELVEKKPDDAMSHAQYAEALMAIGDDAEAASHIERALILDSSLWQAHQLSADLHSKHAVLALNQRMVNLMQGHLRAAESEAQEAVRLAPQEAQPLVTLFVAKWLPLVLILRADPASGLKSLGSFEEMGELLKKAADLTPDYPRLRQFSVAAKLTPFFAVQMVRGLEKGVWEELDQQQRRILTSCRDELQALAAQAPELKADALLFLGVTTFMMGDKPRMYALLSEAANADPTGTSALEATIGFQANEGNWEAALKTANEAVTRRPSGKAYTWLGRIYSEQSKWKEAEQSFRVALSYRDSTGLASLGLGVVILKSGGNAATALEPLHTAVASGQAQPEALLALGVAQCLFGDMANGRKTARQALSMMATTPELERAAKEIGVSTG